MEEISKKVAEAYGGFSEDETKMGKEKDEAAIL